MDFEIKGIHLEVDDKVKEYIEKKMQRLEFAQKLIVDLLFRLVKESNRFKCEVTINFRWGHAGHIEVECFDIFEGIDRLFDKVEVKINREKTKIQEHS